MRVGATVAAVALSVLATACTSDGEPSSSRATASPTCRTPAWNAHEIRRVALRPVDEGGPFLDRELRVTISPQGDLCLQIVIDGADPGATSVSYRVTARRGHQHWEQDGEDPDDDLPLRVSRGGCVRANGHLTVLGAEDRSFRYRARLQVGCRTVS